MGYARPTKPCRWRGKWLHHGGEFACLCFASQKPYEREFFVRARTDLGVKLLISYFPKEYFSYIIVTAYADRSIPAAINMTCDENNVNGLLMKVM